MRLTCSVDGKEHLFNIEAHESLASVLRRYGFFQVKTGCGIGDCGSCVVLVDGVALKSCLLFAASVEGREIKTVVGLGDPEHPTSLQKALVEEHAVQCGFCIPGFVTAASALLENDGGLTADDAARHMDGHMCRCTGYVNQKRALSRVLNKEFESSDAAHSSGGALCRCTESAVGGSVEKRDALSLACGRAAFTEDISLPGMLYGAILPSPYAHARVLSVDAGAALALPGVHAVVTPFDVNRNIYTTAAQGWPEPSPQDRFILDHKLRFVGDRVVLVAAESPEIARRALKFVNVEYEVLEAVFDPERALLENAPVIHDEPEAHARLPIHYSPSENLAARVSARLGDVDAAFETAFACAEETYRTPVVHHAFLEPHVCVCYLDEYGRMVIRTSTQAPFHVRRIVAQALSMRVRDIRVVKPRVGGGFGGKQEVILEPLCALLVRRTGRPVKMRLDYPAEFVQGRTRHAQSIKMRGAVDRWGRLTALSMDVLSNTGAYGSHCHTVLNNVGAKSLPMYRCPNVLFRGKSVYTNLPQAGAFRGYGAPQGIFALETLIDEMAHKLNRCPLEFRLMNIVREGDSLALWEKIGEGRQGIFQPLKSCGLAECLEQGARAIGWHRRRKASARGRFRRGLGLACAMEGSGIAKVDMGAAWIKLNDDGSFNLAVGAVDIGQGSDTVLAQMAASVLDVPYDDIILCSADTDSCPFDAGAYASSTTYVSGQAVMLAAQDMRKQLLTAAASYLGVPAITLSLEEGRIFSSDGPSVSLSLLAHHTLYESGQRQLAACCSFSPDFSPPPFAAQFVEVEVDTRTGFVRLIKIVSAVDCGRPVNPGLVEGQIHGAVVQGLGLALTEEMLFDGKGHLKNAGFSEYPLFRMVDIPCIETIIVETLEPTGPFGAKSVGELPHCAVLPAVGNAIFNATGRRLRRAPFTAERVWRALQEPGSPSREQK